MTKIKKQLIFKIQRVGLRYLHLKKIGLISGNRHKKNNFDGCGKSRLWS